MLPDREQLLELPDARPGSAQRDGADHRQRVLRLGASRDTLETERFAGADGTTSITIDAARFRNATGTCLGITAAGARCRSMTRPPMSRRSMKTSEHRPSTSCSSADRRFNLMGGPWRTRSSRPRQRGTCGVVGERGLVHSSAYTNGDIKFMDSRFVVSLGVRLDDYESWGKQTTGNAGFSWQVAEPFNVYVNYGTSFKPATMAQLFNPQYGDPTLSPETGRTAELGFRSNWLDSCPARFDMAPRAS